MAQISMTCTRCGSEINEGMRFCTLCGTPIPQGGPPEKAIEGEKAIEESSGYQRFLSIDASGGFLTTVGPALIWYGAVGVLIWSIIGLLSLRFDIGALIDLPNLLFSMLIMVGIVLSATANYYLVRKYRERTRQPWYALSYLPYIWGALISAGLLIMISQVWTDFAWGPDFIRRTMFSLIGVGVCGTYAGYLAIVVVGPERIYEIARRVLYILLAIIAVEILDATWLGSRGLFGQELMEHFRSAGGTATSVAVVYSIIAFALAQANDKRARIIVLVTYASLGLVGFTIAVWALWDNLPAGAIRFVHGGTVFVTITTIGLLLVQHFHKNSGALNLPAGSGGPSDQSRT